MESKKRVNRPVNPTNKDVAESKPTTTVTTVTTVSTAEGTETKNNQTPAATESSGSVGGDGNSSGSANTSGNANTSGTSSGAASSTSSESADKTSSSDTANKVGSEENKSTETKSDDSSSDGEVSQKVRKQVNKKLGLNISVARTRRHLDKLNLNQAVEAQLILLKPHLNKFKEAESILADKKVKKSIETVEKVDEKEVKKHHMEKEDATEADLQNAQNIINSLSGDIDKYTNKVDLLSKQKVRLSNDAAVALSVVCDVTINQIVNHTMENAVKSNKKIMQISHVYENNVDKLSTYSLIKTLPSFVKNEQEIKSAELAERNAEMISFAVEKAKKDMIKEFNIKVPKKDKKKDTAEVSTASPAVEEAAEQKSQDESNDSKTSFKFYVHKACKKIAESDEKYAGIRVSTSIKDYLSDLLVELIQRLSTLILLTAASMKNKTINNVAIMRAVELIMIDGHRPVESLKFKETEITNPQLLKEETKKRDEEKKAGRKYKIDVDKIAKINGIVIDHSTTYPTSGFADLKAIVDEKLATYKSEDESENQ